MGYKVKETNIMREVLYMADEVFFSGTAAEISPIKSVDKIKVGTGMPGKVTKKLQNAFFEITTKGIDKFKWLTYIKCK
jgi:branched-chain amino acid aminotransferase